MIISENKSIEISEFHKLMRKTDYLLNLEAKNKEAYYAKRNCAVLEEDVFDALTRVAVNSPFNGTIQLVSGSSFPDIVANGYYGIEVKSTKKNQWCSIGSSILESTRIDSVKKIYLTFGKLGSPVEFRSRPYEECLSGISVTHYPRYQINMELNIGETIFDKMGVTYDDLRRMDNCIEPVSRYYKGLLKTGESLWWATDRNVEEEFSPPTVRLWSLLSPEEKERYKAQGYALFPELLHASNPKKYNRYALWLVTKNSIVNTNVRDSFSAGGKVVMRTSGGFEILMPAVFGRIQKYHELILDTLLETEENTLKEYWETDNIEKDRLNQWCKLITLSAITNDKLCYKQVWDVLAGIFHNLKA